MELADLAIAAETHLNDLQADIEAGSRHLDSIHGAGEKLHDSLFREQLQHARHMGALLKQIGALRACVKQQRETMRELRHDLRRMRTIVQIREK
jgi:predicted RNase H-like nuclease (RuvC/YqgF family)